MAETTFTETEARTAIRRELDALEIDSLYTARGNLVAGQRWQVVSYWLGLPATVLSTALASGAGVTAIIGDWPGMTAFFAFLAAILVAARGFLKPDELAKSYSTKGNKALSIRNRSKILRNVDLKLPEVTDGRAAGQLKKLREEYDALLLEDPLQIPNWAYRKAKAGIEGGESDYILKSNQGGE